MKLLSIIPSSGDLDEDEEMFWRHTGHVGRHDPEEEEEEEELMCLLRQEEQKEWRQERVLTGRVKSSRHTGHVREDLRSFISFLRSEEREGSEEEEDMEGTREGPREKEDEGKMRKEDDSPQTQQHKE